MLPPRFSCTPSPAPADTNPWPSMPRTFSWNTLITSPLLIFLQIRLYQGLSRVWRMSSISDSILGFSKSANCLSTRHRPDGTLGKFCRLIDQYRVVPSHPQKARLTFYPPRHAGLLSKFHQDGA